MAAQTASAPSEPMSPLHESSHGRSEFEHSLLQSGRTVTIDCINLRSGLGHMIEGLRKRRGIVPKGSLQCLRVSPPHPAKVHHGYLQLFRELIHLLCRLIGVTLVALIQQGGKIFYMPDKIHRKAFDALGGNLLRTTPHGRTAVRAGGEWRHNESRSRKEGDKNVLFHVVIGGVSAFVRQAGIV